MASAADYDLVINNGRVMDPETMYDAVANVGIKDGKIVAVGKAGNPATMDGVHPKLVVGAATTVRDAEGMIATPGGNKYYGNDSANGMPAFKDRLSAKEMDLLVRWMVGDYYKTTIEPYKSRIEDVEAAIKERGETPAAKTEKKTVQKTTVQPEKKPAKQKTGG